MPFAVCASRQYNPSAIALNGEQEHSVISQIPFKYYHSREVCTQRLSVWENEV
jgi:hypothetical protein